MIKSFLLLLALTACNEVQPNPIDKAKQEATINELQHRSANVIRLNDDQVNNVIKVADAKAQAIVNKTLAASYSPLLVKYYNTVAQKGITFLTTDTSGGDIITNPLLLASPVPSPSIAANVKCPFSTFMPPAPHSVTFTDILCSADGTVYGYDAKGNLYQYESSNGEWSNLSNGGEIVK